LDIKKDKKVLEVKDHSVSNEFFELFHNRDLDMLITSPMPDDNELPKYYESDNYISHTDGKRSVFEKVYQFIKTRALKKKIVLINSLQVEGNLLDIGAGTGDFLFAAKQNGWKISGTEPSVRAKEVALKKGIQLAENTSEFVDNSFDIITMWHVLEHVADLEKQIQELKRLLKPKGTILIAVPNFKSYDAQHYKEFWAAYDVPRHLWHFSKTAIAKLFGAHEIVLEQVLPMKYDAFYVSLLSEKYKTGRMNPTKAFYIAALSNVQARKSGECSSHIYILKNKI